MAFNRKAGFVGEFFSSACVGRHRDMITNIETAKVQSQLARILESEQFQRSPRLSAFLEYVVGETLAGRGVRLKGFSIAVEVFGRDETFDGSTDPLVRVQARNLRKALELYYQNQGSEDPVRIQIPRGVYSATFKENTTPPDPDNVLSIAVLPFGTIGVDDSDLFLADGITHELVTGFTRYSELELSVKQAPGELRGLQVDVIKLGQELGVRFVVQGTVQVAGENVRVTAQLLDAKTGFLLWARDFDQAVSIDNLFEIQDEITRAVVSRTAGILGVIYTTVEKETRGRKPEELSVHEAVILFNNYISTLSTETHHLALRALSHLVDRNPDFSPALACLAELHLDGMTLEHTGDRQGLTKSEMLVQQALELDPSSLHATWMQAQVRFHQKDRESCMQSLERLLELNARATFYSGGAGWMMALMGEWERGLDLLHNSMAYNPAHPGWFQLAPFQDCFHRGDYHGALTYALKFNMPTLPWDQLIRSATRAKLGEGEKATEAIEELLAYMPGFPIVADRYIRRFVFITELADEIIDTLHKAGLPSTQPADDKKRAGNVTRLF